MLYLITGRLRSGKTTYIYNEIESQIKQGNTDVTLIVPEQFSFASEKAMLGKLGPKHYSDVSVLSFSRLADKLVPPLAIKNRAPMNDAAKVALMSLALKGVSDKLELYQKQISSPGVINSFLQVHNEMSLSCVTGDRLREVAESIGECSLRHKLHDIAIVCDAYDTEKSKTFFDPADKLELLYDVLCNNQYFKDKLIYIDGFRGFTELELKIIERMLADAKAVYITLCIEHPDMSDTDELFAHTARTRNKLKAVAKRVGSNIAKPQNLSLGNKFNNFPPSIKRFDSPELAALESNLFDTFAPVYDESCDNITIMDAPDIYTECEIVACQVKKLIRENGYRNRDIAIIARNSDVYEVPLRSALRKCSINVFEDSRHPISVSPVITLVLSAIAVAANGWSTENIMRFLKTGLTPVTEDEICLLENYTYLWQIDGSGWLKNWTNHPGGYGCSFTDDDKAYLDTINSIREKTIEPLVKFTKKINMVSAQTAAKAIVEMLLKMNVPERLKELASQLENQGVTGAFDEQGRYWDILMGLLDAFVIAAGERFFNAKELEEMILLMFNVQTVGDIPNGLDEVVFGSADRIRLDSPKAVFIIGANYGVFPAIKAETPPFNDKDRRTLESNGIELASFGEYKIMEERMIAYSSFCCAKEKLFVSYNGRDSSGTNSEPSELVEKIRNLFPNHREIHYDSVPAMDFIESKQTAFEQLARQTQSASPLYYALREYFENDDTYSGRISALDRAVENRSFKIENRETAESLFGRSMSLTASRAEKYHKCPFSYFCEYGLKANPRKTAKIDVLQRGTIIHYALEKLLGIYQGDSLLDLDDLQLSQSVSDIVYSYLDEFLGGREDKSDRFLRNYNRIILTVNEIAHRLVAEFRVCRFRPVDFELEIGGEGPVPAYELDLPDGEKLSIYGSVDRVDFADDIEGKKYIRVIDYKSSGKEFKIGDVFNGLNMQMLIYLFALWQNGSAKYGDSSPAGVIYYPAKAPNIEMGRGADESEIRREKEKNVSANGLVLDDVNVIRAMEKDAEGLFIPVKINDKGKITKQSYISISQLEKLKNIVEEKLVEMTESLKNGYIEAFPVRVEKDSYYDDVCRYCDYKAVCFYEEGIEYNVLEIPKNEEARRILDGEVICDE